VTTTTLALVQTRGVLGDLLESGIERDPRFNLVARVDDIPSLPTASGGRRLDAVIVISDDGSIPPAAARLLHGQVCTTVLAVSSDGKRASLRRRNGETGELEEPSPAELLESVRPEELVNGGLIDA
jgi:hypothetical protein